MERIFDIARHLSRAARLTAQIVRIDLQLAWNTMQMLWCHARSR